MQSNSPRADGQGFENSSNLLHGSRNFSPEGRDVGSRGVGRCKRLAHPQMPHTATSTHCTDPVFKAYDRSPANLLDAAIVNSTVSLAKEKASPSQIRAGAHLHQELLPTPQLSNKYASCAPSTASVRQTYTNSEKSAYTALIEEIF